MSVDSDLRDETVRLEHFPSLAPASISSQAIPYFLSGIDAFIIVSCSVAGTLAYQTAMHFSSLDVGPQVAVGVLASMFYVLRMSRRGLYDLSASATSSIALII